MNPLLDLLSFILPIIVAIGLFLLFSQLVHKVLTGKWID